MVNFSSSLELFIRKMLLEKMVSNPDRILGIYSYNKIARTFDCKIILTEKQYL